MKSSQLLKYGDCQNNLVYRILPIPVIQLILDLTTHRLTKKLFKP